MLNEKIKVAEEQNRMNWNDQSMGNQIYRGWILNLWHRSVLLFHLHRFRPFDYLLVTTKNDDQCRHSTRLVWLIIGWSTTLINQWTKFPFSLIIWRIRIPDAELRRCRTSFLIIWDQCFALTSDRINPILHWCLSTPNVPRENFHDFSKWKKMKLTCSRKKISADDEHRIVQTSIQMISSNQFTHSPITRSTSIAENYRIEVLFVWMTRGQSQPTWSSLTTFLFFVQVCAYMSI